MGLCYLSRAILPTPGFRQLRKYGTIILLHKFRGDPSPNPAWKVLQDKPAEPVALP